MKIFWNFESVYGHLNFLVPGLAVRKRKKIKFKTSGNFFSPWEISILFFLVSCFPSCILIVGTPYVVITNNVCLAVTFSTHYPIHSVCTFILQIRSFFILLRIWWLILNEIGESSMEEGWMVDSGTCVSWAVSIDSHWMYSHMIEHCILVVESGYILRKMLNWPVWKTFVLFVFTDMKDAFQWLCMWDDILTIPHYGRYHFL